MTKKILLVDDEDSIREVAQMSLEVVGGWEVITASSGTEALALARAQTFDAVLLDVMMPDMDGPSVFQELRAGGGTKDIPVVLLTAKVQSSEREAFESLGVDGVLSKPFDPMTLANQVGEILRW